MESRNKPYSYDNNDHLRGARLQELEPSGATWKFEVSGDTSMETCKSCHTGLVVRKSFKMEGRQTR